MKLSNAVMALALVLMGPLAFARGDKMVDSSTVMFEAGSSMLASSEVQKIRMLVMDAKSKGKIAKAEVAVWSDKAFPMSGDLPRMDRNLADKRIDSVKQVLHNELGQMRYITTYNMADSANWLARTFRTNEAELDAVFAKKDIDVPMRKDFDIIKRDGAPSKAVIVLKVKPNK